MKLLVLLFGALLLANVANAESPREQFKQMVGQLQTTPSDDELREKIIKLAQELRPAPALPDAAVEFEGRARFAFEHAKSNDDYLAAAREYEKAVANAPWESGYYSDLCTIYEKAGKFDDAKRNCEFSLIGVTDAAQITDIKRRIAGLKYGIEQTQSAKQSDEDWLVVPRVRIGPIRLGMPASKLFEALGQPSKTTRWGPEGPPLYKWLDTSFSAVLDNDVVVAIWGSSPRLHTKEGVKVGMEANEVREMLGRPISSDSYYLCYADIMFNLKDDRISNFFLPSSGKARRCE